VGDHRTSPGLPGSSVPSPTPRSTVTLQAQLLVLAKEPLPGRAKTRLTPALTPEAAAEVARACLLDTLAAVAQVDVLRATVVLDGSPAGWLPDGLHVLPQRTGELGDRLDGAFADAARELAVPSLLIGMDTPQVGPDLLREAVELLLRSGRPVLGAAEDGGWWALGLPQPLPGAFDGVPMSTARAGEAQRERLTALGRPPLDLPVLRDVDLLDDLLAVAGLTPPGGAVAAAVARLAPVA